MTREAIEQMDGLDLDKAVYQRVFGKSVWPGRPVPEFWLQLHAAWEVVFRMVELGYYFEIRECVVKPTPYTTSVTCVFYRTKDEETRNIYSGTCHLATAICRAALIALAADEEDELE